VQVWHDSNHTLASVFFMMEGFLAKRAKAYLALSAAGLKPLGKVENDRVVYKEALAPT
jgi:hypothetical protein